MRSLIRFLVIHHVFLLFLTLEVASMVLILHYNNFQRVHYLNSANRVTASIYKTFNTFVHYFRLSSINQELALENSRLKSELSFYRELSADQERFALSDTSAYGKYRYKSALIINKSVNKQYNYLVLDQGKRNGISPDQGIICEKGVVGIVNYVSESYATGLSLLNRRFMISGKLKKNNYFGTVSWDGMNYRYVQLSDIPSHIEVNRGDTVVTAGSSTYFPEGILIGTVESCAINQGESFYTIRIKLSVDFKAVTYVEIIRNRDQREIKELENRNRHDQNMD
jgi:rod shape-determining protein MreC